MNYSPLREIAELWARAKTENTLKQKIAMCLTTIDANGFPNSRFLDLKKVSDDGLIFCTSLLSQKAADLQANEKCSITIWWEHISHQIRCKGRARLLDSPACDSFWRTRKRDARITSLAFSQSEMIGSYDLVQARFSEKKTELSTHDELDRPDSWGCYIMVPEEVEILEFMETRLHRRNHYTLTSQGWKFEVLQP